jgi:hypothetical protein
MYAGHRCEAEAIVVHCAPLEGGLRPIVGLVLVLWAFHLFFQLF